MLLGVQVELRSHAPDDVGQRQRARQDLGDLVLQLAGGKPEALGDVALGVRVDDQHMLAELGQRVGQVDRRGSLGAAALLI